MENFSCLHVHARAEKRGEQWNLCKYSYTIFIKFSCGFFAMTCINRSWEMGKERSLRRIVNLNWILRPLCARSKGFHEKRLLSGAFFGKTFIQFQSLFDQWTEMSSNSCCKRIAVMSDFNLIFDAALWPQTQLFTKKVYLKFSIEAAGHGKQKLICSQISIILCMWSQLANIGEDVLCILCNFSLLHWCSWRIDCRRSSHTKSWCCWLYHFTVHLIFQHPFNFKLKQKKRRERAHKLSTMSVIVMVRMSCPIHLSRRVALMLLLCPYGGTLKKNATHRHFALIFSLVHSFFRAQYF